MKYTIGLWPSDESAITLHEDHVFIRKVYVSRKFREEFDERRIGYGYNTNSQSRIDLILNHYSNLELILLDLDCLLP